MSSPQRSVISPLASTCICSNGRANVECRWFAVGAEVRIDGILMARLESGSKPGWSRLARCAGPLARPLEHHR